MVPAIWPYAGPLIAKAIQRTKLSDFAQIEAEVMDGRQLLWIASEGSGILAAATTQLCNASGVKICVLSACGGRGRERWLPLMVGIEKYARNEGCAQMHIYGRKGWQRVLSDYRAPYVILQKDLG